MLAISMYLLFSYIGVVYMTHDMWYKFTRGLNNKSLYIGGAIIWVCLVMVYLFINFGIYLAIEQIVLKGEIKCTS